MRAGLRFRERITMKTWLLVDTQFLCYRAYYSTGHRTYDGIRAGVLFGLMRDIVAYRERFDSAGIVFCFDSKNNKRKEFYSAYKAKRKAKREDPMEDAAFKVLVKQIAAIRMNYLPQLGFRNVLSKDGYEADDLIAACCRDRPADVEFIIVSRDRDMYQLLNSNVLQVEPGKKDGPNLVTPQSMFREYGVGPEDWVTVKAIMGDDSDNLSGVAGVGVKGACNYVQGEATDRINGLVKTKESGRIIKRNIKLMKLPWPGIAKITLQPDRVTREKWKKFALNHGVESLSNSWRR